MWADAREHTEMVADRSFDPLRGRCRRRPRAMRAATIDGTPTLNTALDSHKAHPDAIISQTSTLVTVREHLPCFIDMTIHQSTSGKRTGLPTPKTFHQTSSLLLRPPSLRKMSHVHPSGNTSPQLTSLPSLLAYVVINRKIASNGVFGHTTLLILREDGGMTPHQIHRVCRQVQERRGAATITSVAVGLAHRVVGRAGSIALMLK